MSHLASRIRTHFKGRQPNRVSLSLTRVEFDSQILGSINSTSNETQLRFKIYNPIKNRKEQGKKTLVVTEEPTPIPPQKPPTFLFIFSQIIIAFNDFDGERKVYMKMDKFWCHLLIGISSLDCYEGG